MRPVILEARCEWGGENFIGSMVVPESTLKEYKKMVLVEIAHQLLHAMYKEVYKHMSVEVVGVGFDIVNPEPCNQEILKRSGEELQ